MKALYLSVLLAICTSVAAQGVRIVPTYPGTPYRDFSRNTYVIERGEIWTEQLGVPDRSGYGPLHVPSSIYDDRGYDIDYDPASVTGYPSYGHRDIRIEPYPY